MKLRSFFPSGLLAAGTIVCVTSLGCTAPASDEAAEASESGIEVFGTDLWAGLTSVTIERYSADPCGNGQRRLDDAPIAYDSWARQRAGARNVCFEVWKPGVTDRDDPDFWRKLDVQVHYRQQGATEWKTAYVPSIDRRGNNRRYAWNLSFEIDPISSSNVAEAKAAFDIVSQDERSVQITSQLEFFFTVNGKKLSTSTNKSFRVAYSGLLEKPSLGAPATVLHPDVVCTNGAFKVGSGPGYFAAVIDDQAAIDALDTSAMIPAAYSHLAGAGVSRSLSIHFSSLVNTPPGQLPRYVSELFSGGWRAETHDAGPGKLAVSVKAYDPKAKALKTLTHTFTGCVKE